MKTLICAGLTAVMAAFSAFADSPSEYWEYDASVDPQTITDGNWTLVVSNPSDRNLTLGVPTTYTDAAGAVKWPWDEGAVVDVARVDGRLQPPFAFPSLLENQGTLSTVLDLSKPIYTKGKSGDAEEMWQITAICNLAFNNKNTHNGMASLTITKFVAPTTLRSYGYQVFSDYTKLTEIVFNCPDLTGLFGNGGYAFAGAPLTKVVLNIPKVREIGQQCWMSATLNETDLSTWDLSGVTVLGAASLAAEANKSRAGGPTGSLSLPSLQSAGDAAFDCWTRVSSLSLGGNGNLASLGKTLMWNPDGKSGLSEGPTKLNFGLSANFTLDPYTFFSDLENKVAGYPNGFPLPLAEVSFSGEAPSVETLDRILAIVDGAEDGTKPIKVFAPMSRDSWKAVTREMTETEATAAAALEAQTGLSIVGVYETADGRRPAWLVERAWEYDAAAATISDGVWTISVSNPAGRELAIGPAAADRADGRTTPPYAFPNDKGSQSGALDLTGTIYTKGAAGDKNEIWTITELCDQAFRNARGITSFAAPKTLKKMGVVVFCFTTSLKEVIFDCPEMEGTFACSAWLPEGPNGQGSKFYEFYAAPIENMVLKLPKVSDIGSTDGELYNFTSWTDTASGKCLGATFLKTDVSAWDLSGLKHIYRGGLQAAGAEASKEQGGSTGELCFPNVETFGKGALDMWTQLTALRLGTSGTLKSIDETLIWNGSGVTMVGPKEIDFGASWDFTVNPDAFTGNRPKGTPIPFESLWFTDKAPSVETLDRILTLRTGTAVTADSVKIYAPVGKPTWVALTKPVSDDEAAAAAELKAQGLTVAGVYETAAGQRVAWIVRNPRIKDPAFLIRVR